MAATPRAPVASGGASRTSSAPATNPPSDQHLAMTRLVVTAPVPSDVTANVARNMASSPKAPGAVGAKDTVTVADSPGARRPPAGTHVNGHRDVVPGASTSRSATRYDTGNADGLDTSTVACF